MIAKTTVETHEKVEVINVTDRLAELIGDISDGLAFFYTPHTTAALLMCEDDDELRDDLIRVAENWLADCRPFKHIRNNNPNTEAHVLSAFGSTGLTIKAKSPLRPTFTIELANGYDGYIPPPEQHKLGGYTTWRARSSCLEAEAEPKIVAVVLQLLEQVAKDRGDEASVPSK